MIRSLLSLALLSACVVFGGGASAQDEHRFDFRSVLTDEEARDARREDRVAAFQAKAIVMRACRDAEYFGTYSVHTRDGLVHMIIISHEGRRKEVGVRAKDGRIVPPGCNG